MRWLKTLVIGMGALIVIGLTVVIVKVAQQAGGPAQSVATGPAPPGPPGPPGPPVIGAPAPVSLLAAAKMLGDISVAIPAGAAAEELVTDAGRLIVRLRLTDGRAALLLIDASTGKKLGMITLDNRSKGP
ncbi:MAG: hypothetical protein O3C49_07850 [Proteobacteria bacterium]|nr:hypothetical protein [Pseudomonadota bacterium]MDA1324612.1 hypothetical protein [Pseudomonadota bacterium]